MCERFRCAMWRNVGEPDLVAVMVDGGGERRAANPESTQASAAPKSRTRIGTPMAMRITIPSVFQGAAGSLIGIAAF